MPPHSPEADRCSRVFLRTLPSGFFHKHSSGRRIAVTSLPRPPEIPCFFFPQSCRAFSMTAFPSGALPLHSPEADRCSRVFLQTMPTGFFHKHSSAGLPSYSPEADRCSRVFLRTLPTGFFHKHSSVNLPSYSPEADRCSRVFLRTILTGFFHKHSSGRRIAVTSLPRPPEIPCFFFPQSCRAFSMTAFPSGALPSHSPEADRCSRVFLRTISTGFFHKHSSGRRDAGEYKQLSAAEAYPRVQK